MAKRKKDTIRQELLRERQFVAACQDFAAQELQRLTMANLTEYGINSTDKQESLSDEAEYSGYLDSLSPADRRLLMAYDEHDSTAMRQALADGASPNLRLNWQGNTLAVDAVLTGQSEAAELLLKAGADPTEENGCLLFALCSHGPAKLLSLALQAPGVTPDFSDGEDTLAEYAALSGQTDCLRVLRAAGADVHANDGRALCQACSENRPEVVRYLIEECGADLEAEYDDWSPLFYAARDNALECARILLKAGADPLHRDICNGTPAGHALSPAMQQLFDRYLP